MTELTNREALSWSLMFALGLCLAGLGVALSANLVLAIIHAQPETVYPVGGPMAGLAGGLCLALAFSSRRLSRLMASMLLGLAALLMPLALANTALVELDMPRVGVLPGLPVAIATLCLGYILATLASVPSSSIRIIAGLTVASGLVNLFPANIGLPLWARLTLLPDLNPATAIFLIIGGGVLLKVPRLYQDSFHEFRRPVLWVGVLGVAITVISWYLASMALELSPEMNQSLSSEGQRLGGSVIHYLTETLILFGGLALTVLIMVNRLFGAMAIAQNHHLRQVNDQLQDHLTREQDLRETNERIINFSSDLLCIIDRKGIFRFVSPSSRRILGYAPSEMEGRSARDFVVEEDWDASHKAANQLRAREPLDAPQLRNRYRHRDGHLVTLDWKARTPSADGTMFCVGRDMTAELKAEELAQQREAFFSLTPEMFCIVADNYFLEVNQAFLTTLGYTRSDLLGRPYLDIIHPDYHDQVIQAVAKLIRGATIYELEILVLHQKGIQRWLRLNASMHDQRIYCSARDITREKEVQKELREKEHLLSMAEHIGRLGGWMVDRVSGKSIWSDAVCEIHDLPPGEAPDVNAAILYYTPEYRPRVEDAIRVASELGLPFDYEARIETAKGRSRWVRVIGEAVRDQNGEIITLQGALQDITASKEASDQIRRLAERQSRIFESITDGFFTLDREWRFTFMNAKSEQLLQRSRNELLGDSLWEAFPEAIGTEFDDQYRHAMATGETTSFEAYFEPLSLWCDVKTYPSEEGLAIYFNSINERKQAEQELEATMAELERSNRELQDFAFVASHDLQEPLRKIQTFSDRLLRDPAHLDEREQDYLQRMQAAAKRMQTLIMDLLSYSRVSTRAQPFQSCDLNRITAEVLQDLEFAISAADAHIEISPLPTVEGDPSQLRQVIQNLLSNAVKFRRPDVKPEILVYPDNVTDRGWTLVIEDNGTGFDPSYADRLFQPFQRLHSKNDYAGTGIGLAIVRKIVERHQGTIIADGRPGEGAIFRIHFTNSHTRSGQARESRQS
ncbi:PAS domain S-box protein [Marinobacter lacisalsi]|uniref:histidine kinase n=1 Tax=Marinobacter lacisalsi TaxID=475979 RepID=A0ABV8QAS8_9GAMM